MDRRQERKSQTRKSHKLYGGGRSRRFARFGHNLELRKAGSYFKGCRKLIFFDFRRPGVQGGLFGVQEGAVGSQEVAGKWRCMNHFSQKVEDFSRFFEIGSFRPWRRRRWSRLAERSPKPVSPTKTDKGKWVSDDTRKIRRFSRRTCRPGYWPVIRLGQRQRYVFLGMTKVKYGRALFLQTANGDMFVNALVFFSEPAPR